METPAFTTIASVRTLAEADMLAAVLRTAGLQMVVAESAASGPASTTLVGTTWVITGSLSQPRPVFEEIIKQHGGKISGSVPRCADAPIRPRPMIG